MEQQKQEKLQSECQEYHYSQSSKVSNLSRNIIYGIIGTCWILIYADNRYHEPCIWLTITMALCFIYLLLDLIHYFSDACSYRNEYFKLNYNTSVDRHETFMNTVSKRSFHLLIAKFTSIIVIAIIFIIGILTQLRIIN